MVGYRDSRSLFGETCCYFVGFSHASRCLPPLRPLVLCSSVRLFDTIRRATLHSVTVQHQEVNLQQSWDDYLGDLADKFFPGVLEW